MRARTFPGAAGEAVLTHGEIVDPRKVIEAA